MRRHLAIGFALGLCAASSSTSALADVIHEMPIDCPKGTEKGVSHEGTYCVPPLRADCPAGYVPRVYHSTSYCEAPPPAPCPKGLHWESTAPDRATCRLNPSCESVGEACSDGTCEAISFCIEHKNWGRYTMPLAHGVCSTQADCAGVAGTKCEKRLTCNGPAARKNESARIEAAKSVPASAVPAPYVASDGGPPPRYRILKDGESLPPLPDVPAPPDAPPSDPKPNDAPVSPPKPPNGGGCAGCVVGTSDRDMVGWAALMTLIGVGIALRRRGGRG